MTQSGHWLRGLIVNSRVWIFGVWIKQRLAINLVVANRLLAFWRHQPIDKRLSKLLLHCLLGLTRMTPY